jgi:hypothetical protein
VRLEEVDRYFAIEEGKGLVPSVYDRGVGRKLEKPAVPPNGLR